MDINLIQAIFKRNGRNLIPKGVGLSAERSRFMGCEIPCIDELTSLLAQKLGTRVFSQQLPEVHYIIEELLPKKIDFNFDIQNIIQYLFCLIHQSSIRDFANNYINNSSMLFSI
jgi:hypothetical protein